MFWSSSTSRHRVRHFRRFLTWPLALDGAGAPARTRVGCWVEVSATICPLHRWKITCATSAARPVTAADSWPTTWLRLYPPALTWHIQWVLAGLLVGINAVAYGRLLVHSRSGERFP